MDQTGESIWRAKLDVFVGRRAELQVLLEAHVEEQARVLLLSGPGGIGKSTLAQKLLATARANGEVTTWAEIAPAQTPVSVLESLVRGLPPTSKHRKFDRLLRRYYASEQKAGGARGALARAIEGAVSSSGAAGGLISGAVGVERIDRALASTLTKAEHELLRNATSALTDAFVDAINGHSGILLLDRYEHANSLVDAWVREDLVTRLPEGVSILITARDGLLPINVLWQEWAVLTRKVTLSALTSDDTAEYALLRSLSMPADSLWERSRGLPWIMELAANGEGEFDGDFSEELELASLAQDATARFVQHFHGIGQAADLLVAAAVIGEADEDLLVTTVGAERSDVRRVVRSTLFMPTSSGGFRLRDPVRDVVLADSLARSPAQLRELANRASQIVQPSVELSDLDCEEDATLRVILRYLQISTYGDADVAASWVLAGAPASLAIQRASNLLAVIEAIWTDQARESISLPNWRDLSIVRSVLLITVGDLKETVATLVGLLEEPGATGSRFFVTGVIALADAAHRTGRIRDGIDWIHRGLEAADSSGDRSAQAILIARLAESYGVLGEREESIHYSEMALDLLASYPEGILPEVAASVALLIAYVYAFRGDPDAALVSCDQAQQSWPADDRIYGDALLANARAWISTYTHQWQDGLVGIDSALAIFRRVGDHYHHALASMNKSALLRSAHDFEGAMRWAERARAEFLERGAGAYDLATRTHLSLAMLELGLYEDVIGLQVDVFESSDNIPLEDIMYRGMCLLTFSQALSSLGESSRHDEAFTQATDLLASCQSWWGRCQGLLAIAQRSEAAESAGKKALEVAINCGFCWLEVKARRSIARVSPHRFERLDQYSAMVQRAATMNDRLMMADVLGWWAEDCEAWADSNSPTGPELLELLTRRMEIDVLEQAKANDKLKQRHPMARRTPALVDQLSVLQYN